MGGRRAAAWRRAVQSSRPRYAEREIRRETVCLDELRRLPWRRRRRLCEASLSDGRWRYGGRDAEIFNSIFYGCPKGMPAYGGVVGQDGVWMLVNYLKSLPQPDVVPTQSWIEPQGAESHPNKSGATAVAPQMTSEDRDSKSAGGTSDLEALTRKDGCATCHANVTVTWSTASRRTSELGGPRGPGRACKCR